MRLFNSNKRSNTGGGSTHATVVSSDSNTIPLSKEVDTLLSNELRSMSLQQRENILHEIHGVDDIIKEDPTFVELKFQELNEQLDVYCKENKAAARDNGDVDSDPLYYVLHHSPDYVRNSKFMKMFLRSVKWDVPMAVNRLRLFFTEKQHLFGTESLGRDITLVEDLLPSSSSGDEDRMEREDNIRALRSGYSQVLPGRDNAGRAIWLSLTHIRRNSGITNMQSIVSCRSVRACGLAFQRLLLVGDAPCLFLIEASVMFPSFFSAMQARTVFYSLMTAVEDEETQVKGVLNIKYDFGKGDETDVGSSNAGFLDQIRRQASTNDGVGSSNYGSVEQRQPLPDGNGGTVGSSGGAEGGRVVGDRGHYLQVQRIFDAVPIRLCAIHVCYINPNMIDYFSMAAAAIGANYRCRVRFHHGNHMECHYALMTFGIVPQLLPVSMDGVVSLERHYEWIECRKLIEDERRSRKQQRPCIVKDDAGVVVRQISSFDNEDEVTSTSTTTSEEQSSLDINDDDRRPGTIVHVPNKMDVLMGRGNLGHHGNIRFRTLIDEYCDEYETSHRMGKTVISETIVMRIQGKDSDSGASTGSGGGGRFLKREKGYWVVMTDDAAREKVSHRFRNLRNQKPQQQQKKPPSGILGIPASAGTKATATVVGKRGREVPSTPISSTTTQADDDILFQDMFSDFDPIEDNMNSNQINHISVLSGGGGTYDSRVAGVAGNDNGCFGNVFSSNYKNQQGNHQGQESLFCSTFW